LWKGILLLHIQNASFNCCTVLIYCRVIQKISIIKTPPKTASTFQCRCPSFQTATVFPPLRNRSHILFTEERPQMKPVSFSHSCIPVCSLTHLYTCPKVPYLNFIYFAVGIAKLLLHTGRCIQTELITNTLYAQCASHMQYFINLLNHENFIPCINPTSLMDMPIPNGKFQGTVS
jgi:hypothetical protein